MYQLTWEQCVTSTPDRNGTWQHSWAPSLAYPSCTILSVLGFWFFCFHFRFKWQKINVELHWCPALTFSKLLCPWVLGRVSLFRLLSLKLLDLVGAPLSSKLPLCFLGCKCCLGWHIRIGFGCHLCWEPWVLPGLWGQRGGRGGGLEVPAGDC